MTMQVQPASQPASQPVTQWQSLLTKMYQLSPTSCCHKVLETGHVLGVGPKRRAVEVSQAGSYSHSCPHSWAITACQVTPWYLDALSTMMPLVLWYVDAPLGTLMPLWYPGNLMLLLVP